MKFDIKSHKGFTLIELLVVIGILAVLAAIAIPSVAGLIDRANVSSDKTNSNEMTNAIERFASEYELYKQDIASGVIKDTDSDGKPDNLDSAQGRVYNVTKVVDRNGITNLEKDASAGPETTGPAIYRDTNYPVNAETVKLIIQNYTKTSSSTFEPKQSDMHYWYSPDCGVVVVATPNSSVAEKNDLIISGMDAKGNVLVDEGENVTIWIDITINITINGGAGGEGGEEEPVNPPAPVTAIIPDGGKYYVGVGAGNVSAATTVLNAGESFPEAPTTGDVYVYNNYEYRYNYSFVEFSGWSKNTSLDGWGVQFLDRSARVAPEMLFTIANKDVIDLCCVFKGCRIEASPALPPNTVTLQGAFCGSSIKNLPQMSHLTKLKSLENTFNACKALGDVSAAILPSSVTNIDTMFCNSSITKAPNFNNLPNVTQMDSTFLQCSSLTEVQALPPNVGVLYCTFQACSSLKTAPVIPSKVYYMAQTFSGCNSLTGEIVLNTTASNFSANKVFQLTTVPLKITGSASNYNKTLLLNAASNPNVTIG